MTSEDAQWWDHAACDGTLTVDDLFIAKGQNFDPKVKEVCAGCPVFVECLVDSFASREAFGGRAGCGPGTRRALRREWLTRDHDYSPTCRKRACWCRTVDAYRASLTAPRGERPRLNLNGPNAAHGKASTYARGCGAPGPACGPCSLAYSPLGRRLRDARVDILDWWHRWVSDDSEAKEPEAYDRARVLAGVRIALGDQAESLHAIGVDVVAWWQSWFGDQPPVNLDDPRWVRARVLAVIDATEAA